MTDRERVMNDRFKLRAKDKRTGEWRYGYYAELPCGLGSSGVNYEYADTDSFILTCTKKQSALYSNAEPHEVFHCEQFRVDGKTLSQCTGIQDKNGKLIFEADILKVTGSRDVSGYGVVEYLQAGCQFFVNGYLDYPSPYHLRRKGEFHQPLQEWLCTEVVGNIYENPELLRRTYD